jgi:hypothetical protein
MVDPDANKAKKVEMHPHLVHEKEIGKSLLPTKRYLTILRIACRELVEALHACHAGRSTYVPVSALNRHDECRLVQEIHRRLQ